MINEIPDYGPPRHYLPKWTADEVKELSIRCCICGRRIKESEDVCEVCDRMLIQGD